MAVKYKNSLIIIGTLALAMLSFFMFWFGYQNFLNPKLGNFTIQNLVEENSNLILYLNESHNATHYEIMITNQSGEKIYQTKSTETTINLTNITANYGDTLKIKATAFNKNNVQKDANTIFNYDWKNASFINLKSHYVAQNSNAHLQLYGYNPLENYKIRLEYLNHVFLETEVSDSNIVIPSEKLNGYAGRITAKLYNEKNRLIHKYNFYVNTPVIGKLKMETPTNNFRTRWNDINLSWSGGENASEYKLLLYNNGQLENEVSIAKEIKKYTIPANYFKEESNYTIVLKAILEDYEEISEMDTLDVYISKKETTNPVFVSHHPNFIKKGTKIKLSSRTEATIYYTLDNTTPNESSLIYKEPITIDENQTIKTYAASKNRFDSAMNTYDFKITNKMPVVYLSPSNQYMNYGAKNTGFTNEMEMMNKVADEVSKELKKNNIQVYRNKSSDNINVWLDESNKIKSDLHLAIHSNASSKTSARGIEIYVDSETSKSLSIASNIIENLYEIYPGKNEPNTNRGVKYAAGSLGEVNDNYITSGTLIEIAYHDNREDALWITENIENIGKNIAQSIIKYYT